MRKGRGKEAQLSHSGHLMMENRSGLCVAVAIDRADGHAERRSALKMIHHVSRRHQLDPSTIGLDGGYVDGAFLADLELERGRIQLDAELTAAAYNLIRMVNILHPT